MSERVTGWVFVAAQFALLAVLVAVHPWSDPLPQGPRAWAGIAVVAVGTVIAVAAALALGDALTPTPVPKASSALRTGGPYRWVRHPIYTGLLVAVAGFAIWSGHLPTVVVGVLTIAFFVVKARWEERRLRDRFDGYAAYAATTPMLVPGLRRRGGGGHAG